MYTAECDHVCVFPNLLSFLQLLSAEPNNTDALFHLADVYFNLQNYDKARELHQQVIQLIPTHKGALYKLGWLYYKSENYGKAVGILQRLSEADPDYMDVARLLQESETQLRLTLQTEQKQAS